MKKQTFILSALLSFLIISCADNPTGTEPGTVWGYVDLVDQDGLPVDDESGATVSIVGTSFSTTTDADGMFEFKDVPPGVYQLKFEKTGYGWLQENFQFVGNGEYYAGAFRQSQIPTYTIEELTYQFSESDPFRLQVNGKISEPASSGVSGHRSILFFYSLDPAGPTELITSVQFSSMQTPANSDVIDGHIDAASLKRSGIQSGTTVYFRAYPGGYSQSLYRNDSNRKRFYTSLPATGTDLMSFVMP